MMKFESLAVFTAVADAGSISEAARRLGVPKSVVSERLVELERELGGRLAQRTTRKMCLTEDGRAFLPRARRILQEAQDGRDELAERRGQVAGPLRLSAPVSFGCLHLAPALIGFIKEHPKVAMSLELDDRFVDITSGGFDAVIRHGPVGDGRLVAHRLALATRVLIASPAYLAAHGEPRSLEALDGHRAVLYSHREADWRFQGASGMHVVRPTMGLRVNNGMFIRDAAVAGLGIALVPLFIVFEELRSGALKALNVGYEPERTDIKLAYPRDRVSSPKLLALTRHLRLAFGNPPYWEITPKEEPR